MAETDDIKQFIDERYRRTAAKLDKLIEMVGDGNIRLTLVETRLTSVEGSVVHVHERLDGMQGRLALIDARVERIEKRLDLVEST